MIPMPAIPRKEKMKNKSPNLRCSALVENAEASLAHFGSAVCLVPTFAVSPMNDDKILVVLVCVHTLSSPPPPLRILAPASGPCPSEAEGWTGKR